MPKTITVYDLLISCPSDVTEFIPTITKEIDLFNNYYGRKNNVIIRALHWSKDTFSQLGNSPQDLINEQLVDTCDIAICILWTRFGTPTQMYGSGTEEEIERLLSQNKQVFLFFLNKPINPTKIDVKQYINVQNFKEKLKSDGIFFNVNDEFELAQHLRQNLELYFNGLINGPEFKKNDIAKKVLWVDDRPENNVFERTTLHKQYGIEFSLALSTKQALSLMKNHKFSLVISDMGREEGPREGYVLLKEIRRQNKEIPFIIYAGSNSPMHIQETLRQGGQGCTNNPIELIDMVIKNLLKT